MERALGYFRAPDVLLPEVVFVFFFALVGSFGLLLPKEPR
jgi:hypothetical protein